MFVSAKVAAQIVDFYGETLKFLTGTKNDTPVADTVNSSLAKVCAGFIFISVQLKTFYILKSSFCQCCT